MIRRDGAEHRLYSDHLPPAEIIGKTAIHPVDGES